MRLHKAIYERNVKKKFVVDDVETINITTKPTKKGSKVTYNYQYL